MTVILPRRQMLKALASTLAAPAIVKAESLMRLPRPRVIPPGGIPSTLNYEGVTHQGVMFVDVGRDLRVPWLYAEVKFKGSSVIIDPPDFTRWWKALPAPEGIAEGPCS